MQKDKDILNKQVNDIITDLENLDTAEILESESTIKDYNSIIENADSDPLSIIGSEVGHWKIIKLLGVGGMSIVYLVERNDDQIQKQAALKIIPNTIASKNMIDRFLRERQILSDLNHNNIAQLYDAGVSESEIPWFVMELVHGEDILTFAETHSFNTVQRIGLFKQVCDALVYAHSRGVIHRDIKPNNLLVNQHGTIKLLDFGIAAEEEKQSLTMTGAIIGTPGYMSPEQAKGLNQEMDKRTDIFSLGVLLYKLIKKDLPFKAGSISEISYKIIHDEPTLMGNKIPADLQAITFKCLEKRKENRYQSVVKLTNDLDLYLNGDEVSARKITVIGRLKKKIIKHPVISLFFSLVTVITLFSIVYGVYQSISSLKKVQLAEKYTAKSEEIKANIWRTHMLPVHDPNKEYEQYNTQIENLKQQIQTDNAAQSGQANYALGKAYQAMSDNELAHENFMIARNKGWSSVDLMAGLGETFSYKWQTAIIKSKAIKDITETKQFLENAKIDFYDPAMQYLKLASQGTQEPFKLLASMAYNEENYPQAIEYINKEIKKNPWNFTVLNTASKIHLLNFHKQSTEKGYDTALQELIKSNQYLEKAIDIGRSYPANYTSRCSNAGIEVQLKRLFDFGREMQDIFNSGLKYCQEALIMQPKAYSPWANMSYLYTNYARYLEKDDSQKNTQKIIDIYQKSIENADKGLLVHPKNEKMLNSKVQPFLSLAQYNQGDFLVAKSYYNKAIEAAIVASSIDSSSVNTYISLGLAHAAFANYLRDSETDNMYSLSEKHYLNAIESFKNANQNGKDFMGQMNLASTYNEYAQLHLKQNNFITAIEILTHDFTIRDQHTLFQTSQFFHIKELMETSHELIKLMQKENIDFKDISKRTEVIINKVCQIEDLSTEDKQLINQFIQQSKEHNWAQENSYPNCQLN